MEIICKNGTPTTRNPLNVYEQAQIRLEKIFGHFDNIYVSFSGGKDSGVLLQLCTDYIRKHCPGRKIGVFHLDYEIQYGETIRYRKLSHSLKPQRRKSRSLLPLKMS